MLTRSLGRQALFVVAAAALSAAMAGLPGQARASSLTPGKVVAGWVEKVTVHSDTAIETKAKLDSGAKTSSIHGEDIERFERDGDDWVRFTLVLKGTDNDIHRAKLEKPVERNILIKDHDDPSSRRPIVELPICFDGRLHDVQFSLADRGDFIYSVLLGRRFLKEVALIDPDATFLTKARCEPQ